MNPVLNPEPVRFQAAAARRWIVRPVALLILAALVTACPSINRLREAQDAFNRAATAENVARLGDAGAVDPDAVAGAVAAAGDARLNYQLALRHLEALEADPREWGKLAADDLAGTALTLQALAHWRLGHYDEALAAAGRWQTNAGRLLPRDEAMVRALPGLVLSDQAFHRILADTEPCITNVNGVDRRTWCYRGTNGTPQASFRVVTNLIAGPVGALQRLEAARQVVPTNHPVQVYLLQSKLAAYVNLATAFERYRHGSAPSTLPGLYSETVTNLLELLVLARQQSGEAVEARLRQHWGALGIAP